jgi:glycosyl transferase family 25
MAQECKIQAEKFGIHAEYFDAINGLEAEKHYEITGVPKPKKSIKKGRPGVLGCFFSHYYLWRKCLSLNEPICILEHDGYFIQPLPENICDLFDDVLKLDLLDPYNKTYNTEIENNFLKKLQIIKYVNPSPKNIEKIGTGNYFKGAYSYIIKPSGARKLLTYIHENKNQKGHRPADQQIGDAIVNTWVTTPTIARLHPFYSIDNNIKTASLTSNLF